MKARASMPGAAVVVAWAVALLVSWPLLARGVALSLAKTSPNLALRFHAGDPEALVRVNEFETDHIVKAQRARRVLAQRPLDGRAYRQLAEVEEAAGRTQAAAELHRVALRNTPRDRLSQAWAADDALLRGAASEAMDRLMLLADMDATLWPRLFPYLRQLSLHEVAWSSLMERMVGNPPWRSQFLDSWEPEAPHRFDTVMLALVSRGADLSAGERELWVRHLRGRQRWTAAYLAWAGGLDKASLPERTGVFNGGFETAPSGQFDWVLAQEGGSHTLLATEGAGGGRALRIGYTGPPDAEAEQLLVLPSGKYAFDALARLDELRGERGLAWSVRCVRDQALLGAGPALRGSREWHAYDFEFIVPVDCPAQHLVLGVPAGTAMERRVEGVAWFDEISVAPIDTFGSPLPPPSPATAATAVAGQAKAYVVDAAESMIPGIPAALVASVAGGANIERQGRTVPVEIGTLLLTGDRVLAPPPARVALRWRDDCEMDVAGGMIATLSSCEAPRHMGVPVLKPGAVEIVRASIGQNLGVPGSSGAELPVGP